MEAILEKNILEPEFPFRLFISKNAFSFPHHWHDEIEIIYIVEGCTRVGVNSRIYNLQQGDVLLISSGEVHYFLPVEGISKRVIIQFNLSLLSSISSSISDKKFIRQLFDHSKRMSSDWNIQVHGIMRGQIQGIIDEYMEKKPGYKLALKARLYDLVVALLRYVPMETCSPEEENKHQDQLQRLESVFQYVENNYNQQISLEDAAAKAGFSMYHFTRFFKECTGITFGQFLSNYRVTKSEWFLMNGEGSITEIAYKSGFNSIKTFNRIFKQYKGCSPSEYIKRQDLRST